MLHLHKRFFFPQTPIEEIKKMNKFMGTNCSHDTIDKIAKATSFKNMKAGKGINEEKKVASLMAKLMNLEL